MAQNTNTQTPHDSRYCAITTDSTEWRRCQPCAEFADSMVAALDLLEEALDSLAGEVAS